MSDGSSEGAEATGAAPLPLVDVRVVEFTQTIMGPSAGMILADLGAEVVKVEPAPGGDRTRRMPGFASGFYGAFNRNKRSLALNLKDSAGREVAHRLCARADVVVENYAPGTMERLGCGYADLSAINPRLVYCALKGFLSGPYENRHALDEVVQFMGGLAYMTGPPGRPLRAGASIVDILGGTMGVVAVLAALRERERTGRGTLVKSALFETTAFLMAQHMAGQVMTGKPVPPMPARDNAWGIYEPFDTADGGQVFIGMTSDNHWHRFCARFGLLAERDDPRYQSNEARVAERGTLVPLVAGVARAHRTEELLKICEEIEIPFAPVARGEDLFADPHLNAGRGMAEVDFENGKRAPMPRLPMEMAGHDLGLRLQPPVVGEHTHALLVELGYSTGEIEALVARGAVLPGVRP